MGWAEEYREGVLAVEIVEEKILFITNHVLVVKSSDGWPPCKLQTIKMDVETMRAFADVCNEWIERASVNVSIPVAEVICQQPISTETRTPLTERQPMHSELGNPPIVNVEMPKEASAPLAYASPSYAEALDSPSKV